ncbi:hypothetical protein [Altererythrobacter sp. MF3-039]|uniref:hypothetical protein n=1 Tax=Altererythrobacter sp. MF3-039 TaxID=3252901 RepID=UPI00390C8354
MSKKRHTSGKSGGFPALLAGAAMALAIPSAGLAVATAGLTAPSLSEATLAQFTPAKVDPQLAQRVAKVARDKGIRFTPAELGTRSSRSVTVAVRVDDETARAITVRSALQSAASQMGQGTVTLAPTRYNLGVSRGYQSFAKPIALPKNVNRLSMPDLATFKPREATAPEKPNRFQPRIALEEEERAGRTPNTLQGLGEQSVDVGGAYRVTRNLDVTAGVRLSQDRDRLAPLTDAVQDNQAVYVGTQFRF